MDMAEFKDSVRSASPPRGTAPALKALWWAKKGDWHKAHKIVMDENARDAAWVHAHLHRVEGDRSNAEYWYRQAKKPAASGALDKEWDAIVAALLEAGATD